MHAPGGTGLGRGILLAVETLRSPKQMWERIWPPNSAALRTVSPDQLLDDAGARQGCETDGGLPVRAGVSEPRCLRHEQPKAPWGARKRETTARPPASAEDYRRTRMRTEYNMGKEHATCPRVLNRPSRPGRTAVVWALAGLMLIGRSALATPSGLNNIPTADVVPERKLVLQVFGTFENNIRPDHWAGLKLNPWRNLEVGLDGRLNPESAEEERAAGQLKYRLELREDTALAIGVANLGNRAWNGYEDYYAVLSHDLGFCRVHAGGTLQRDNEGLFAGIDKTVTVFGRDVTLRSDVRQVNERDDTLGSAGLVVDLGYNLLLETWGSFSSDSDANDVLTVKFNYVISF